MTISSPFVVTVTLAVPPDVGEAIGDPVEFSYSGSCTSIVRQKLELTGSGTRTLDMGTLPVGGAKLVLIRQLAGDDPITVCVNGGTEPVPIGSSGAWLLVSPVPDGGVADVALAYSSAATVSVWILG